MTRRRTWLTSAWNEWVTGSGIVHSPVTLRVAESRWGAKQPAVRAEHQIRTRFSDMSFSMASLLLHSEVIPARARDAIKAAHRADAEARGEMLESAAQA